MIGESIGEGDSDENIQPVGRCHEVKGSDDERGSEGDHVSDTGSFEIIRGDGEDDESLVGVGSSVSRSRSVSVEEHGVSSGYDGGQIERKVEAAEVDAKKARDDAESRLAPVSPSDSRSSSVVSIYSFSRLMTMCANVFCRMRMLKWNGSL